ncbi:presenilin family intramembrane aspartyl protease [Candidatus Marsarchaeota archaeon]|nr:presenilin family intramembrane aspartyl protease [Candidatus Marsarchaeota archaeon]MCL5405007.1 presenilin family intramembrane aspartyl protease [Candidatus Marsarchaeota archaeon]
MERRVIENRQLFGILTMFMIVQFAGLALATLWFNGASFQQVQSTQVINTPVNALLLIAYIIFLAIGMLVLFRFYRGVKIYVIIEALVLFIASFYVFLVILAYITQSSLAAGIGAIILSVALIVSKNKWPKLKNVAAIIASIGVGAVLGFSFSFIAALIFMVLLAVYDFIAVFITKHMLTLANVVTENNLAFMVDMNEVEAVPRSSFTSKELREYESAIKTRKSRLSRHPAVEKAKNLGLVPVSANVALGTGDLAIPLMVAVAAFKVSLSFVLSFFVVFGAVIGLVITMFILRRYKRALPAIPPLLLGVAIGLGLYYVFYMLL